MTQEEIQEVGDLQRQQVPRIFRDDVTVELGRTREIAAQPGARGIQVHAFPRERVADMALGGGQRVRDSGLAAPLGGRGQQACLEAMSHDELGSMASASSIVAMGSVR